MRKFVEISIEALERLESGRSIDGSLKMDLKTRRIVFNDWKRKAPKYYKEKKICDLDYGFLAETAKHITRHEKFPKSLSTDAILEAMDNDNMQSMEAVVDRDIIDNA